jgi:hypothetical protein
VLQVHFLRPGLHPSPLWDDYYWRRVKTRAQEVNLEHELKYAF